VTTPEVAASVVGLVMGFTNVGFVIFDWLVVSGSTSDSDSEEDDDDDEDDDEEEATSRVA